MSASHLWRRDPLKHVGNALFVDGRQRLPFGQPLLRIGALGETKMHDAHVCALGGAGRPFSVISLAPRDSQLTRIEAQRFGQRNRFPLGLVECYRH